MGKNVLCHKCKTDNPVEAFYCRHCGAELRKPKRTSRGRGWLVFFLLCFAISTAILAVLYIDLNDNYYYACRRADTNNEKYAEINSRFSTVSKELEEIKNKVSSEVPLFISSIDIANVYAGGDIETEFGSTIYSSNTMYLQPRIRYYGFRDGKITLKTKWYNPDGSIRQGTSSPNGYTYSDTYNVSLKDNTLTMHGWGNEHKGHWGQGTYRIEVWYNDICLKAKTITIY